MITSYMRIAYVTAQTKKKKYELLLHKRVFWQPQTESTTSRTDFAKFLSQQPVLLEEVYKRVTRYFDNARKSRQPLPSPVPMINVESSSRGGREEVDYCAMLQQLGVEQKFDILFIDLFQLSLSGKTKSLVYFFS